MPENYFTVIGPLALVKIRFEMDSEFRNENPKEPLWEIVSREYLKVTVKRREALSTYHELIGQCPQGHNSTFCSPFQKHTNVTKMPLICSLNFLKGSFCTRGFSLSLSLSLSLPPPLSVYVKRSRKKRVLKGTNMESRQTEGAQQGWRPSIPSHPQMGQMVCGSCRRLLSYPLGARYIECSSCQTVNLVLEAHQVGQVKCGHCSVLLMYPYGAPSVRCSSCNFVTDIGEHNERPPLSVQQGLPPPLPIAVQQAQPVQPLIPVQQGQPPPPPTVIQ